MARSAASSTITSVPPPVVPARPLTATQVADPRRVEDANHPAPGSVLQAAALHSLGWLLIANLTGVWLAVLLLFPEAGRWLGEWSYGRWTPVHLNFQLYGWIAFPLVAWAIRLYGADRAPYATAARTALIAWSLALTLGAFSWLNGHSSGKLFLDWTGYTRVLFPVCILFLWVVLVVAHVRNADPGRPRSQFVRAAKLTGLVSLLAVPFLLYAASSPQVYPALNPDTGGPTGASQLESTLVVVLILLLLPFGLTHRKPGSEAQPAANRWVVLSWVILAAEAILCSGLGREDVSHHRPVQFLSLASLLLWVSLIPAYFGAFAWPRAARPWLIATFCWWGFLVPTGWAFFLPGVLDRLKFTDGLVAHSLLAMAGFVTSLLILILIVLADTTGAIFASRWAFYAWHGATLAYVLLFLWAGWREGADPAFTMVPGMARDLLYEARLLLGLIMTAASAQWFRQVVSVARLPVRHSADGSRTTTEMPLA